MKNYYRILRAATAGIVSRHERRYRRGIFDMKQIKEDAKEETEVFQVQFRHVQLIGLGYICAILYSWVILLMEIIHSLKSKTHI